MVVKEKNEKKNELFNLLYVIRTLSTLALFELMFFMTFMISYLLDFRSIELIDKLKLRSRDTFRFFSGYIIIILVIYMTIMFINYLLIKKDSKHLKKIFIIEIVLLIIAMISAFVLFTNI